MRVIVNVGVGFWYAKGSMRLNDSLINVGYKGKRQIYSGFYPNQCPKHEANNYGFKAYGVRDAVEAGGTSILWCDSSIYAVKSPEPIFDIIDSQGYYFIDNGNNCAQTATDKCLTNFGITRDEAEKIPESTTCVFGFSMLHEKGKAFYEKFIYHESIGSFNGGRTHRDEDSTDKRFWFSRHDQTVASLIAGTTSMNNLNKYGDHVMYYSDNSGRTINKITDSVCLINHGHVK